MKFISLFAAALLAVSAVLILPAAAEEGNDPNIHVESGKLYVKNVKLSSRLGDDFKEFTYSGAKFINCDFSEVTDWSAFPLSYVDIKGGILPKSQINNSKIESVYIYDLTISDLCFLKGYTQRVDFINCTFSGVSGRDMASDFIYFVNCTLPKGFVGSLTSCSRLSIDSCSLPAPLDYIPPNVKHLYISDTEIKDLSFLKGLPELESVTFDSIKLPAFTGDTFINNRKVYSINARNCYLPSISADAFTHSRELYFVTVVTTNPIGLPSGVFKDVYDNWEREWKDAPLPFSLFLNIDLINNFDITWMGYPAGTEYRIVSGGGEEFMLYITEPDTPVSSDPVSSSPVSSGNTSGNSSSSVSSSSVSSSFPLPVDPGSPAVPGGADVSSAFESVSRDSVSSADSSLSNTFSTISGIPGVSSTPADSDDGKNDSPLVPICITAGALLAAAGGGTAIYFSVKKRF